MCHALPLSLSVVIDMTLHSSGREILPDAFFAHMLTFKLPPGCTGLWEVLFFLFLSTSGLLIHRLGFLEICSIKEEEDAIYA